MKKNTFEIGLDLQSNWSDIYQATDETDKYHSDKNANVANQGHFTIKISEMSTLNIMIATFENI